MFNKRSILVLFIDRNRLQFYAVNLPGVVTLDVPETYLHDLDVIDHDGLYTLVKQWVKQYPLTGAQLIMIFSDTSYFEKVFSSEEPAQLHTEIIKFFDTVPFESTMTRVYDVQNGKRAVAVNKDLYEAIRQGFSLQGVPTKGIIPVSIIGAAASKRILDAQLGEYVLKNLDTLLHQSLIDVQEPSVGSQQKVNEKNTSTAKKSSMPLLLGVFGVLLVILLIMVLQFI